MECRIDLSREEVEKIIVEHMNKIIPPPTDKAWDALNDYSGTHCVLINKEKKNE